MAKYEFELNQEVQYGTVITFGDWRSAQAFYDAAAVVLSMEGLRLGFDNIFNSDTNEDVASDNDITINEDKAGHIFRDSDGHFNSDTPENRDVLEDVSNSSENHLGADKYGNEWYGKTRSDGSQVWTQVRNGKIVNGGVNDVPKVFNDKTGLSNPSRGW